MYTSRTTVHTYIDPKLALVVFISAHHKSSWRAFHQTFDRLQRRETSNILWQTWVGVVLKIAPVMPIWARLATAPRSAVPVASPELYDPPFGIQLHYLSNLTTFRGPKRRKAKCAPDVRCYKLLARPAARVQRARPGRLCETLHTKELAPSVCTLHRQAFVAADRHMTASILTPESQRFSSSLSKLSTAVDTAVSSWFEGKSNLIEVY